MPQNGLGDSLVEIDGRLSEGHLVTGERKDVP